MNTYGISMELKPCFKNPGLIGEMPGARHFSVTLTRHGNRQMHLFYSVGAGWKTDPTLANVLETLHADAGYFGMDFPEFCSELGFNEDSRKDYADFEALQAQNKRLREFLGDDLDAFLTEEF